MKRILALTILIFGGYCASAQTYGRLDFSLQNAQGQAISGAQVNVYTQSACGSPAAALATLYPTATGGTPLTQPLLTDGFGHAFAYVAQGCVTITYNSPYTGLLTYPDQVVLAGGTIITICGNSVCPVVNVTSYGAKGDCSTDDSAAITVALTAANASNPALTVYFPTPPGGCYYVASTLPWFGVSLEGEPPKGVNPPIQTAGVVIKGAPGKDIFHAPDPTAVSTPAPRISMSIRDIVFEFDDTVDVSSTIGAHRWPGRWV